ncbi:hypothetical protein, partial [Winogradskyella psychrotolerans]|uniref:hypothetical protein n=1 Tax=Winogradskyella psychrotolerans TaxID=1344585 RepID=UPI001F1B642D
IIGHRSIPKTVLAGSRTATLMPAKMTIIYSYRRKQATKRMGVNGAQWAGSYCAYLDALLPCRQTGY